MSTQLSLFDLPMQPTPIARAADPQTSKLAAEVIRPKLVGLQLQFVERLRQIGKPATANEVSLGNESIRKRALELVRSGVIQEIGARECNVSGKMATVYWLRDD